MACTHLLGIKSSERPNRPVVTFGQQRHLEPYRSRSRAEARTDRCVTPRPECPGERRANVVDLRDEDGRPAIRGRLVLRRQFEEVQIIRRVALSERVAFAAL